MSHELILEGTLGVDARRAASKIRDHLLANPATWLSEVGRVAMLSSATKLAIDQRATSIVIEWNGEPTDPEVVEAFGRHLLNDAPAPKKKRGKAVRDRRPELLTLAVFAALGDIAKAVDITVAIDGAGAAPHPGSAKTRRLTRLELEGALEGVRGGVRVIPRVEAFTLLPDASGSLVIDLGRSFAAIRHWLGLGPRLTALHELSARLGSGLEITVDGEPLGRTASGAVLSLELPPIGDLELRLDLLEQPFSEPRVIYYELGFEIARSALLAPVFEAAPLRLVVSAPELPTNASRSQVDEGLADTVRSAAMPSLASLTELLRRAIVASLERSDQRMQALLEQVSGYLAVAISRAPADDAVRTAFSPVLQWPLLRDAVGRPLSVQDAHERAGGFEIIARADEEPLPPVYAPLVGDVLWRRGVSAEAAFDSSSYDVIAEDVEEGLRRKEELARRIVPFEPPPRPTARWRQAKTEPEGLEWVVAFDVDSNGPCLIRVYVEQDLIETLEMLPPSPFVRFDAAVRWPGVVVADRRMARMRVGYGSGRMQAAFNRAADTALLSALGSGRAENAGVERWLALRLMGTKSPLASALSAMRLWELASGQRMTTSDLGDSAAVRGHLFVMDRPFVEGERAPSEPVVVVPDDERPLLRNIIGRDLIDYTPYASAPPPSATTVGLSVAEANLAAHTFKWRQSWLCVTSSARGRHVTLHRGLIVKEVDLDETSGMLVFSDGETTLAKTSPEHHAMRRVAWSALIEWLTEDRERMASSLTAPGISAALLDKLASGLVKRAKPSLPFDEWPLFTLRTEGDERYATAAEIVSHFGDGPLPTLLRARADESVGDCVIASERNRALLERVTKRSCVTPFSPKPPARVDVPALSTAEDAGSEDLLAAIRDLTPTGAAPTDQPIAELAPPPPPESARAPLPNPPERVRKEPRTWPEPVVVPVNPDDILGPIRHLMTETKARHAAEAQQKKKEIAPPERVASPLLVPVDPALPVASPETPDGAWDRVVGLFKTQSPSVPHNHPLAAVAARVSQNLYLAGLQLRFGEPSEEAVRFESRTKTLVLNPEHPTVRVLVENGDVIPLVAAAFSEINRELKTISDEEERRALGRILLDPTT